RRRTGTEAKFEGVTSEVQIQGMGGESGRELADYVNRTGGLRGRRTYGQGERLDIRLPEVVGVRIVGYIHLPVRQEQRPAMAAIDLLPSIGVEHAAVAKCLPSIVGHEGNQLTGISRRI